MAILNKPINFAKVKKRKVRLTNNELTFYLTILWAVIALCFAVITRLEALPMKHVYQLTWEQDGYSRVKKFECNNYDELADLVNEHMTNRRLDTEYNKVQLVKLSGNLND